ncbi:hypothetical protein CsatA_026659 [Cannabis sativa]
MGHVIRRSFYKSYRNIKKKIKQIFGVVNKASIWREHVDFAVNCMNEIKTIQFNLNILPVVCFYPTECFFYSSTYKASIALPINTIIKFVLVWMFFATPLYLLGEFIGKSSQTEVQAQSQNNKDELKPSLTRVKTNRKNLKVPRFMCYLPQMALAGIFPFSAICVELSSVVYSLWGYENYTQYKFLFVTFILLLIITALINVGLICCKIVSKDHKWWWRSFVYGGSIGLYVYGLCIHYLLYKRSDMSGSLQLSFFFGYMACICYALFLMFGSVGFLASYLFLRQIYHSLHYSKT